MRGFIVRELSDPCAPGSEAFMRVEDDYPAPKIKPGHVRVRVAAASINFADLLQVQGQYQEKPPLPFIPGGELSGTILELGPGVSGGGLKVGQSVVAVSLSGGAFAEEAVVPSSACFPLPPAIDPVAACGVPIAYGTSHVALSYRAGLTSGQTVLILGAAGGVGLAAVQIAKALGAKSIAVATGPDKVALLRAEGADHVLDASEAGFDLRKKVLAVAPKGGVDVLYDPVGGRAFLEGLRCVKWGGQLLTIGYADGSIPKLPINLLLVKNLTLHGVYWGSYFQHRPQVLHESLQQLMAWLAEGRIRPHVSHRVPLERAAEAFRALASRQVKGKAVLVVGGPTARL